MNAKELTLLEELWTDERERPGGTTAQGHVLGLIAEVRQRDEHIKFLLHTMMQPGVGLYESNAKAGTWYVLHNTARGDIIKIDMPDELQDILNSDEGQSWTRA